MDLNQLLKTAREASSAASKVIMEIYDFGDFSIAAKADNSPLTKADKAGHEVIMSFLEKTEIPVLSEEGSHLPYEQRKDWGYLWIVDPLDGTKEFIKKNGEFTVNIALVKNGKPILGVVEAPVLQKQFYGLEGIGAWVAKAHGQEKLDNIASPDFSRKGLKVVASRSHLNQETKDFLSELNEPEIVSMGSSLKFMMIAEGKADVYPRYAPTMEWDTAAAHAILSALGAQVVDVDGQALVYNKAHLLNPFFKVF
jgi:3'(2'), 5'-bisphosphate nucleotidase